MAEVTIIKKVCDVYGTSKGVKGYTISIKEYNEGGHAEVIPSGTRNIDLSPRALKRLCGLVAKGCVPTSAQKLFDSGRFTEMRDAEGTQP